MNRFTYHCSPYNENPLTHYTKDKQCGSKWSELERQEKYALRKKKRQEAYAKSVEEQPMKSTGSLNDYDEDFTDLERMECKRLCSAYFGRFIASK